MLTTRTEAQRQNTVIGRITLKETGAGIPNLVVAVYDHDPGTRPEEDFSAPNRAAAISPMPQSLFPGDSLGSVISGVDGSFSLNYDDAEFRIANTTEKRPDLRLMVLGPEDADSDGPPVVLFSSKLLRVNSGRIESYSIRLTTRQLMEAQIPLPLKQEDEDNTERKISLYKKEKESALKLTSGYMGVNNELLETERAEYEKLKSDIRKKLLANNKTNGPEKYLVRDGENVADKQAAAIKDGVDKINFAFTEENNGQPNKGVPVYFFLDQADRDYLAQNFELVNGAYTLSEEQIKPILSKMRASGDFVNLVHNNPILKYCREKTTDEKCAEGLLDNSDSHSDNGNNHEDAEPDNTVAPEDIPKFVGNLLQQSHDHQQDISLKRPAPGDVQQSVDKFQLGKGPAETAAFHDFHILHVAFNHVWQQLLDQELVALGATAESIAKKSGKSIQADSNLPPTEPENYLPPDEKTISTIPPEVLANFDISLQEWKELDETYRTKLRDIGIKIEMAQLGYVWQAEHLFHQLPSPLPSPPIKIPEGYKKVSSHIAENYSQKLLEQGERIIEIVRGDNVFSYHRILAELDQALKSKYLFTVFGVDIDTKAVNFGLLNTYRQKWEPLAYQVGNLVKTIPLSPKEERKYSVKTVFTRKRADKEARKNNTSLTQEQNTTSRAEAEIVRKANTKTNFSLTTEGGFDLGFYDGTATTSFGYEAGKESQESKKDFREAVLKAAQEFKEERSVEITTEETYNAEYSESGTIVNPNDELAVTYLFYELEKRFRISEQIYRVMPVVLVAQEMPEPHAINETWIISNYWILNRFLLDDSYRPALQYLAAKNVGDDFAIRELRKNLRTQRQMVNALRLEFASVSVEAKSRYAALERAITNRIAEEEADRADSGFFNKIDDFFGGNGDDPEAAKARELAAKEAHEYAVERAEKVSAALQREVNALHQLTAEYNRAMRDHLDKKTMASALKMHIKNNIFYYMQAIWSMEPPDQRYLRHVKTMAPYLEAESTQYTISLEPTEDIFAIFRPEGAQKHQAWIKTQIKGEATEKPLVEIADLDRPLGYKGNYMIFPLKHHNALTELMAMPFVDAAFGAMDPDELSNISLEDYSRFICCLKEHLPAEEFEAMKPTLKKWLEALLANPLRNGDEVVIPSNSLYIEMLTSAHTLLENFKLRHREWDVYKVQAEVRKMEMENIRLAARLLQGELEDPDVEKRVVVEKNGANTNININE